MDRGDTNRAAINSAATSRAAGNSAAGSRGDSNQSPDVVVVGAGPAGLAAANLALDAGYRVRLIESSSSPGGLGRSDQRRGYTFNRGPHALYRGGAAQRVLDRLGIRPRGGPPSTKAMLATSDGLTPAPAGPLSLMRTAALPHRAKPSFVRFFARLPRLDPSTLADRTVEGWLDDAFTDPAARALVETLIRLTSYVDQPDQLSAEVAATQLVAGLNRGVLYLDGGWQQLVDAMVARLERSGGATLTTGTMVETVPDAPAVILATGNPTTAARLLGGAADEGGNQVRWSVGPPARAACLDVGTARRPVHDVVLGVTQHAYVSNHSAGGRLAPTGHWHVSCAQYLGVGDSGDRAMLEAMARQAGVVPEEADEVRYLHDMTVVSAIATADGGLAGRPRVTDTGVANVFLAGDWVGTDGHLLDASLASAEAAAGAAIAHLEHRAVVR